MSDLPIDIHYNKLLDWLISRRHCQQQWQDDALVVREKINNAIQDMPPVEELTKLLQGTYINYFHCLRIVELLKDTESGSKNIFGRYSSQRMKDWLEVVKLYEKNGVGLAEAAQLLMRNVNYEIPSLKKQIAKCKQTAKDCSRKEGEYASNSSEFKEKYKQSCRHLGIEGKSIKSELLALVKDLPATYDKIADDIQQKKIRSAAEYYVDFVTFTTTKEMGEECVPLLRYVVANGNTTCYQYRTGKVPNKVEPPQLDLTFVEDENEAENADAEIDWGALDDEGIDYGGSGDTVDFGEDETTNGIDFGDDVSIEVVADCEDIVIESEEGVAKGTDAMSIMDNSTTRVELVNQLLELEGFLRQRIIELSDKPDVIASSLFQSAPSSLHIAIETVQSMLGDTQSIIEQLNSSKMQDLIMIRGSPKYVHRLVERLKKIQDSSEKAMSLSRLMVIRSEEAREEEISINPRLDLIREKTMVLKKQIEGEISKKYQDRRVNIMGEINTV